MKKNLPDLEIPENPMNRVIDYCRQEYPLESCGILAGKNGKITKFYPMENMEKSSSFILWYQKNSLEFFRRLRKRD